MIGDRHKAPERFYHLATIPGRWNSRNDEARGVGRKWSHKSSLGSQGRGFDSREDDWSPRSQSRDNGCVQRAYSAACEAQNIVICGNLKLL